MATATKQLEAIYQEITARFSGDSAITVNPVDGDPPEKYEINYNVTGIFKDESGDIQEKSSHTVTISIPFGFPHFPPSCKPKSPIFHPDFDPAAICIGDFWEKERSIGDLIFHIGQMITGSVYSTSNAFNEEAAKWYQDNSGKLPFDSLEATPSDEDLLNDDFPGLEPDDDDVTLLLDEQEEDQAFIDDLSLEPAAEQADDIDVLDRSEIPLETEEKGVDTIDDSFLDTDFDYLGNGQTDPETNTIVPPEIDTEDGSTNTGIDVDRLKLMAKQKRFYELDMELGELGAHHSFEGQEQLTTQAADALKKARALYNKGTDAEHQGSPGKALTAFNQVEDIVLDYPGLKEDIERTTQAKELLGDWTEPAESEAEETSASDNFDETLAEEELEDKATPSKKKKASRTFFEDTARKTSKLIPFAVGIACVLIISTVTAFYFINSSTLKKAAQKLETCQAVLKQNRFTEAEKQCESALDIANKVQYFKSGTRDSLIDNVNTVLSSQTLTEGLKGNLLLDGKYLPKQVVKIINAFRYFMAEGDKHFSKEAWQQAASSYKQALNLTQTEEGVDSKLIFSVTENLKIAEFNVLFRSGVEFIEREKWTLATEDLKKALELVQDLNIENKAETVDNLTAKLAEIALATSKEKGDAAFAEGKWKTAYNHYKTALLSLKQSNSPRDKAILDELNQLVLKANLYDTINTGKDAFTKSNWDDAIASYEQAIEILESNKDILKHASTKENRKKLARVMLQASIIRDKQEAAKYLKNQNFEKAIEKLQSIINSISKSDFGTESEFAAVVKDTDEAIKTAQTDLLLADKIIYLEENFTDLFTANYTVASPESLTDQKVLFEKRMGDKLIFQLQCVEVGRGRPLKLVMKYIHDLNTGKWSFYSTSQ